MKWNDAELSEMPNIIPHHWGRWHFVKQRQTGGSRCLLFLNSGVFKISVSNLIHWLHSLGNGAARAEGSGRSKLSHPAMVIANRVQFKKQMLNNAWITMSGNSYNCWLLMLTASSLPLLSHPVAACHCAVWAAPATNTFSIFGVFEFLSRL